MRAAAVVALVASMATSAMGAPTGFRALDKSAIMVKAPEKVALIAITRAGERLVAVGEHGVITYSDDNGQTWRQSAVPVTVTLTAVAFATSLQGWAVGHYGVVLHTIDGGVTWQVQLTGIEVIQLTNAAAKAEVVDTNDSIAAQRALRRANFFAAAGPDKPFLTIWVQDSLHVTIFGAYRMAVKTTDGGKTWSDFSLHIADPLSHHLYGVAAIGQTEYIAAETGLVFESKDGGENFTEATKPVAASLFGVIGTGDGGALVFGVAGTAWRTGDSGLSWQPVAFGSDANLVAAVTLANGAILVLGEDGLMYLSTDHARSFRHLPGIQPMALFAAAQAANGDVILIGNFGVIVVPCGEFT